MPRASTKWEAELLRLGRRAFPRRAGAGGGALALEGFGLDRPHRAPVAHRAADSEPDPPAAVPHPTLRLVASRD